MFSAPSISDRRPVVFLLLISLCEEEQIYDFTERFVTSGSSFMPFTLYLVMAVCMSVKQKVIFLEGKKSLSTDTLIYKTKKRKLEKYIYFFQLRNCFAYFTRLPEGDENPDDCTQSHRIISSIGTLQMKLLGFGGVNKKIAY